MNGPTRSKCVPHTISSHHNVRHGHLLVDNNSRVLILKLGGKLGRFGLGAVPDVDAGDGGRADRLWACAMEERGTQLVEPALVHDQVRR